MSDQPVPPEVQRQVQALVDEACAESIRLQESHAELLAALKLAMVLNDSESARVPGFGHLSGPLFDPKAVEQMRAAIAHAERIRAGGGRSDA